MAIPSISNFIASMDKYGGPSRNQNFYVQFIAPLGLGGNINDLTFQCMGTSIPGQSFALSPYKAYGPNKEMPFRRNFETVQFVLYCTNIFWEKPLFDNWMEYINPRAQGWDWLYKDDFVTDLTTTQLNQTADIVYQVTYQRAFPIEVAPMPLNWESDDVHTLEVTFAYDKYINR